MYLRKQSAFDGLANDGGQMRDFTGKAEPFTGDKRSLANMPALVPHRYPAWVVLYAVMVLAVCGYASVSLPGYVATARNFAQAKAIDGLGHHAAAQPLFREVLAKSPTSRTARLALAKSLFADRDTAHDAEALKLLVGIKLSKSEWDDLEPYIPEQDRKLFVEEKK